MRWSITLPSSPAVVGTTLNLGPDAAGRTARVSLSREAQALVVTAEARGSQGATEKPDHEEWSNRAHLAVYLNPGNDHATRWLYAVSDCGGVRSESHLAIQGEEPGDEAASPLETPPPEAEGSFSDSGEDFRAELRIPWDPLFLDPAAPPGLALRIGFHEIPIPNPLAWPDAVSWTRKTPIVFGDLYGQNPTVAVTEITAEQPAWGGEPSDLVLKIRRSPSAPTQGVVGIRTRLPGESESEQPTAAWEVLGSEGRVRVPVVFPYRAKWANPLHRIAHLQLSVYDENGNPLWSGSYPFSIDFGLIVRERFGRNSDSEAPRPSPSDPHFIDRFRSYILTRLPNYRHTTTLQGAVSDFYLEDDDGGPGLDLMAADALGQAAATIAERFPDWQDALCAAAMWVHHPCITRHSSSWNRIANVSSIDTVPRLGGCFCGDTARITAALAEAVGACLHVPLTGYSMGLRGHLATLVDSPLGRVVIDGMLGLWFHSLDNTRLATLEDMRCSDAIARRVWFAPDAHGHSYFFANDTQLIRPWKSGPLVWPPEIS